MQEANQQADHDIITRNDERIRALVVTVAEQKVENALQVKNLLEIINDIKTDVGSLREDRAKVVGWCVGVSGVVGIIIKLFWPK